MKGDQSQDLEAAECLPLERNSMSWTWKTQKENVKAEECVR